MIPPHAYLVVGRKNPLFAMGKEEHTSVLPLSIHLNEREADAEAASLRSAVFERLRGPEHSEHFVDTMLSYRKTITVVKVALGNPAMRVVADDCQPAEA